MIEILKHLETPKHHTHDIQSKMNAETSTSLSAWKFTKNFHKKSYPALSPSLPGNSQRGKVVVITGASAGIGYGIARGFAAAYAERVIITGRRTDVLQEAVTSLTKAAQEVGSHTVIEGQALDVTNIEETCTFWDTLKSKGTFADVLVLNAATASGHATVLEHGREKLWQDFVTNVRTLMDWAEHFNKQESPESPRQKVLATMMFFERLIC